MPCAASAAGSFHALGAQSSFASSGGAFQRLSVAARTVAFRPQAHAEADTVFMLLTSHDDDDPAVGSDGDYEVWAQKGYAIADTLENANVTWSGAVYLDADFEVQAGKTLTIEPGTRVFAAATDAADTSKVELIVRGVLAAEGTSGSPILFSMYDGDSASGDSWGGIRFELEACRSSAYGYVGLLQPPSSITHAAIENADRGIVIADHGVPNLKEVAFAAIAHNHHLVLESDATIPYGYWAGGTCNAGSFTHLPGEWDLDGGTHVVASTTVFNDLSWIGTDDKIDLVVSGRLFTNGSVASGDSVFFRPDTTISLDSTGAGADWGGVIMTTFASGSEIWFADIGYAENPVFLSYPDSLTLIRDSRIHSFADVGIWIHGSLGTGAVIHKCLVERGAGLNATLGTTGIYLDNAEEVSVLESKVDLEGLRADAGGTGIALGFTKTLCQTAPADDQTLWIEDTYVLGPGIGVEDGEDYVGIRANWLCGGNERSIDVVANWVEGWKKVGMEFVQTADVTVGCNQVVGNNRAVDIYRDHEPTGAAIRFKQNRLEALEQDVNLFALRTNDAVKTKLGPSSISERGLNRLKVHKDDTKFLFEEDSDSGDVLDARNNLWYADALFTDASDSTKIQARLAPTGYNVDISSFETDDSAVPACWLGVPGASMLAGGRSETSPEDR